MAPEHQCLVSKDGIWTHTTSKETVKRSCMDRKGIHTTVLIRLRLN
jgi:hypothetical protein